MTRSGSRGICNFLVSLQGKEYTKRYTEGSEPTLPDLTVLLEDIVSCDSIVLLFLVIKTMTRVILRVQLIFNLDKPLGLTS